MGHKLVGAGRSTSISQCKYTLHSMCSNIMSNADLGRVSTCLIMNIASNCHAEQIALSFQAEKFDVSLSRVANVKYVMLFVNLLQSECFC